jgi:hypothetical protein
LAIAFILGGIPCETVQGHRGLGSSAPAVLPASIWCRLQASACEDRRFPVWSLSVKLVPTATAALPFSAAIFFHRGRLSRSLIRTYFHWK